MQHLLQKIENEGNFRDKCEEMKGVLGRMVDTEFLATLGVRVVDRTDAMQSIKRMQSATRRRVINECAAAFCPFSPNPSRSLSFSDGPLRRLAARRRSGRQ